MRLIDADKLLDEFRKVHKSFNTPMEESDMPISFRSLVRVINRQEAISTPLIEAKEKRTNGDRLRSMDNAEFAEFLIEESKYGHLARQGYVWVKWWLEQEASNENY